MVCFASATMEHNGFFTCRTFHFCCTRVDTHENAHVKVSTQRQERHNITFVATGMCVDWSKYDTKGLEVRLRQSEKNKEVVQCGLKFRHSLKS